jgi:toxin secretion/phage lysis holin
MWDKVLKTMAALGGAIAGFFGEWSTVLTVLIVAMVVDYISGMIVAAAGKSPKTESGGLNSKIGFIGLAKKGMILLVVLTATLLDKAVGNATSVFQTAVACFYVANEGVSILENAALIGLPVPEVILRALDDMKHKGESDKKE